MENNESQNGRQLFAVLYEELHNLAQRKLRHNSSLTLGATTLLHEVYIHVHKRDGLYFPDRSRFFAYASLAMRRLIIDYARSRQALKRGAGFEITTMPPDVPEQIVDCTELERLGDAIDRLAAVEPRLAQVVDLRYFSGCSLGEIATLWGTSERTVQRDWAKARLFLHRCLATVDDSAQ